MTRKNKADPKQGGLFDVPPAQTKEIKKLITGIRNLKDQIEEITQSETFSLFVEGVKGTLNFLGVLINPLQEIMPFMLAELKERGLTIKQLQQIEDAKERGQIGKELLEGARNRAKAYKKAQAFLATDGGTLEEAAQYKADMEDIAKALSPFTHKDGGEGEEVSEIQKKIINDWFTLDWLRDPEEAIATWSTKGDKRFFQSLLFRRYHAIAEQVAKETNSTIKEIMDPKKRTKEQEAASIQALANDMQSRFDRFFSSRYFQAWKAIGGEKMDTKEADLAEMAIVYFFATLPKDAPGIVETEALTEDEADAAKKIYEKIVAFEKDHPLKKAFPFLLEFIKAENPGTQTQEEIRKSIQVIAQAVENIEFPLDKVNDTIWTDLEFSKPNGQLAFDFNFTAHMDSLIEIDMTSQKDKRKGKEAIVLYGLSFDLDNLPEGVKITKQITPYDRRVHDAVGALYRAGNEVMSIAQIYRVMGRKGRPSKTETRKINDSLTKMRAALLYIDSTKEAEVYPAKSVFHYDGMLLPFERAAATINGREIQEAIKVLTDLPLIRFARGRGQITTLDISIRETPLSLTDSHIRIEDYLTARISHMEKNPKLSRKITWEKLFAKCLIKSKKQRFDARAAVKELLGYWKNIGYIGKNSVMEEDGVSIEILKNKKRGVDIS